MVVDVPAELLAWLRPELVAREAPELVARLERPWWPRAACRTKPVALFFPGRGQNHLVRAARAVCAGCAVRSECLAWALSWGGEVVGVWGGTTPEERDELLRTGEEDGIGLLRPA